MDALGQGYSNNGNGFSHFVTGAAGGFAGAMLGGMLHEEFVTRQREANEADWSIAYSQCYAADLTAGVRPDIAEHLAMSQAAYLICVNTRRKLWWRIPLQGMARGAMVYMMWFVVSFLMLLLSVRDNSTVERIISFGFNHWEASLAVGVLWAWFVLHRDALLPFIPFTGGGLQRPWFPGDPAPTPGRPPAGPHPSSGPAGPGSGRVPGGRGTSPALTSGQRPPGDNGAQSPEQRRAGYPPPGPGAAGSNPGQLNQGTREPVGTYLERVTAQTRLWCWAITMFLTDTGQADSERAGRFRDACLRLDTLFTSARACTLRGDNKEARRIVGERVQPLVAQIATWFATDPIAAPRPDLTRRTGEQPSGSNSVSTADPTPVHTPSSAEVMGRALLFAEAMDRSLDAPPPALGPAPRLTGLTDVDQTVHTTRSIVQGFYGHDRPVPTPQQSVALEALANAALNDELNGNNGGYDDTVIPDYTHHENALADLAKVEPDLRLILARYQRFLDDHDERNTPRARRLADIHATIEPDFQQVRAALFAHDTDTAVRILTDRIRPVTDELVSMFGHEDV